MSTFKRRFDWKHFKLDCRPADLLLSRALEIMGRRAVVILINHAIDRTNQKLLISEDVIVNKITWSVPCTREPVYQVGNSNVVCQRLAVQPAGQEQ